MALRSWMRAGLALSYLLLASWTARAQDPPTPDAAPPAADAAQKAKDAEDYELFKTFVDTLDQVERNYVKPVTRRELMEAAIRGVLDKLDPYSNYIGPQDITQFKTSVESQFGGIGIQIDMLPNGRLVVVSPIVGSPAYMAGIQAGDSIIEIDGKPTEGEVIDDSIRRMKGEPGSSVKIAVLRPRTGERLEMSLQRQIVRLDTVLGDRRNDEDQWDFLLDADKHIGYIRVTGFSRETAGELERALSQLTSQGMKGLVLDLRFNPGGLLTSAVEVSDLFLPEGRIVSTAGRNSPERVWDARKPGTFEGFPMAVLVNRFSASASEIVSACLQDHKRAVVVGERTWGKGSVQNVIELEGGKSALKLTTAGYVRPNGHNIHRFPDAKETDEWGVMPDNGYLVRLDDQEMADLVRGRRQRDILQINHFLELQKKREAAAKGEKPASEPAPPEPPKADSPKEDAPKDDVPKEVAPQAEATVDRQLQKALEYLTAELAKAT